jgi:hypothetical protein
VIVVVASCHDVRAQNILAQWGPQRARMLTVEDMCISGWSLSVPSTDCGTSVIGGQIVRPADINGILTLRPCIFPQELQTIRSDDRAYVAAELTAFLLVWLTAQSCPVLNRPTASCLAGPNWQPEQWTQAAAALGIPVRASRRRVPGGAAPNEEETIEIIAAGERCVGSDDPTLKTWTRQLAREAGVELLSARFSRRNSCFLSAHPWPALTDSAILAAVRERLESHR